MSAQKDGRKPEEDGAAKNAKERFSIADLRLNKLNHALAVARHGWSVIHTYGVKADGQCSCGKSDCRYAGKHPRHANWQAKSTTDAATIRQWGKEHPDGNFACHAGPSGAVCLDIDLKNGGLETFAALEKMLGPIKAAVAVETGGGGFHLYFEVNPVIAHLPGQLGKGIDIKHGNGYFMLVGSTHKSGKVYAYRFGCDWSNVDFTTYFPERLLGSAAIAKARVTSMPSEASDSLAEVTELLYGDVWEDEEARVWDALPFIELTGHKVYLDVLMAVHKASGGDEDSKARLKEYCETQPNYIEEHFERDWRSLKKKPGGIGLGTLFKYAKEGGWIDESKTAVATKRDGDETDTLGDISNGRRLAKAYRDRLLYCYATKTWHFWDGLRWALCEGGEALSAAKAVADSILRETGEAFKKNPSDSNRRTHQLALSVHRSKGRIEAMLDMASSEPGMSIANPGLFDADPMLLGVRNGVLNLTLGTLLQASPAMRISKQAGASFDRDARCPMWIEFLHNVFCGDTEMVGFIQRALGYSLTGRVDEEVAFFMHGQGANGKSVFANPVREVLGDYGLTTGAQLLVRRPNSSEGERHKAMLPGARMVLVNEVGVNDAWDDQLFKELASRERLSARPLYAAPFEFMPTHALWIRGNHKPGVPDAGDAMWRRMILIPFERQFAPDERIPDLDRRILNAERDGILAWMVEGCLAWQRDGLRIPARISAATEEYRAETDIMGGWIEELCRMGSGLVMGSTEGFTSYSDYLVKRGHKSVGTVNTFSRQLVARRGITKVRSKKGKGFHGIELRDEEGFEVDDL